MNGPVNGPPQHVPVTHSFLPVAIGTIFPSVGRLLSSAKGPARFQVVDIMEQPFNTKGGNKRL